MAIANDIKVMIDFFSSSHIQFWCWPVNIFRSPSGCGFFNTNFFQRWKDICLNYDFTLSFVLMSEIIVFVLNFKPILVKAPKIDWSYLVWISHPHPHLCCVDMGAAPKVTSLHNLDYITSTYWNPIPNYWNPIPNC